MLNRLLYRGRHTAVASMCALLSMTVTAIFGQTPYPNVTSGQTSNVTVTPLQTNPGGIQIGSPTLTLSPESIGLLSGTTTAAPPPTQNVRIEFTPMTGSGIDIAASVNGSVWLIRPNGSEIQQWSGKAWIRMPGLGTGNIPNRIAVSPDGTAMVVDKTGGIWGFNVNTRLWAKITGQAADIAFGSDGTLCIVTPEGSVQKWNGTGWTALGTVTDAQARRIAVDPFGAPWLMGLGGGYRWRNNAFEKLPFAGGHDIAIGGDGAVWVPVIESGGVGKLQWWNGEKGVSYPLPYPFVQFAVDGVGMGYTIDGALLVQRGPLPGPVPLTERLRSTSWIQNQNKGKLLCSSTSEPNDCGRALASFVGKHEVKMNCSSGFYDPIYGGTCWKCPDETDSRGGWIRSLDPITASTACWRAPKEALSSAIKVKSPSWAWGCPDGSFWDGYSPDGAGGSCWRCPDAYPRRTGFHIKDSNACASPVNETKPATRLSYSGCPAPDRDALGFTGLKQPGQPFLDVAAGGCYACPVVAKDGTFLISVRNGVALYKQDDETDVAYASTRTLKQGCDVMFRYQPTPFWSPGLNSVDGALEVIMENRLFEYPDLMTGMFYALADARTLTGADATAFVTEAWKQVAADPLNSSSLRAVAFLMMQAAAKKERARRTPAENRMLDFFGRFVVERRSYYAQQGLDMYDAWKAHSDAFQSSIAKSPLQSAFSYGVVPLDFKTTITAIAGNVGVAGLSSAGMAAAYNAIHANRDANLENIDRWLIEDRPTQPSDAVKKPVESATRTARVLRASPTSSSASRMVSAIRAIGASAQMVTGGVIMIQLAAAVLGAIATAQLIAIESARPDLLAIVENARRPVDAATLLSTDDGRAQALLYWGQAMDAVDPSIPSLTTMAVEGRKWAEARKYARPKGI